MARTFLERSCPRHGLPSRDFVGQPQQSRAEHSYSSPMHSPSDLIRRWALLSSHPPQLYIECADCPVRVIWKYTSS